MSMTLNLKLRKELTPLGSAHTRSQVTKLQFTWGYHSPIDRLAALTQPGLVEALDVSLGQ